MEPEAYNYVPLVFDAAVEVRPASEATRGQRFVNFLVDGIVCALLWYPVGFLMSAMLSLFGVNPGSMLDEPMVQWVAAVVLLLIVVLGYYFVLETATSGRSVGKFITGTVAVRADGAPMTSHNVFIRSILRIVPVEPFSAFAGRPWHDRFSKTQVIEHLKIFAPVGPSLPDSSANYEVRS